MFSRSSASLTIRARSASVQAFRSTLPSFGTGAMSRVDLVAVDSDVAQHVVREGVEAPRLLRGGGCAFSARAPGAAKSAAGEGSLSWKS